MALTQVNTDGVKDDAVTLAKQAAGTDGQVITYDASGNPVAVGPGTDGQVLTSTGAGSPPAFETLPTSGPTLTGSTDNTVCTVTGANAIQGESNVRIDSSGRLLLNKTASTAAGYDTQNELQIEGTDAASSSLQVKRNSNDSNGPYLYLGKSRGTSIDSDTVVQNGDEVGSIVYHGTDGTDANNVCAKIVGAIDGAPGSDDLPGRLVFMTTADGAGDATERLRISSDGKFGFNTTDTSGNQRVTIKQTSHDTPLFLLTDQSNCYMGLGNSAATNGYIGFESTTLTFHNNGKKAEIDTSGNLKINDGNLVIGTAGHGIDFSATADGPTMASELLDDYEEGTFSPIVRAYFGGAWQDSGFDTSPTEATGHYTKVGNVVTITGRIRGFDVNSDSAGSYAGFGGLPFTAKAGTLYPVIATFYNSAMADGHAGFYIGSSSTLAYTARSDSAAGHTTWNSGSSLEFWYYSSYYAN